MNPIHRAFLKTPIGFLEITGSEKGIQSLSFLNFRVRIHHVPSSLKSSIEQLKEYFAGSRKTFDLPLDLKGSAFQIQVWSELQKIPYGEIISYLELARRIGNLNALRAVGGANGRNPVSIIIPCHRVLGHDGKLVGYGGGLWRKKWLLEHEHAFAQRDLFYMKA
ncbi:MAG: methylated-DNA--[protein]-cysteine S-methyltransferase [Bacteroidales bacterium]|jgi:methylated-DNA-[protein]-cysteine S-methyltransferase|nr:methylated-DNA--[protein]-cysteine S-methyltransferase [Bacteroidales bacterium]